MPVLARLLLPLQGAGDDDDEGDPATEAATAGSNDRRPEAEQE